MKEVTAMRAGKSLATCRIHANREQAGSSKRPDLTRSTFAPKRPSHPGWILASSTAQQDKETWTHDDTALVAVSSVVMARADGRAEYRLCLCLRDGSRCGAALAFMALADFGLMDAREIGTADRAARLFRLLAPHG